MNKKFLIMPSVIIFLQASCLQEDKVLNVNSVNNSLVISPKSANMPEKLSPQELLRYENIVYTVLLRNLYYNEPLINKPEPLKAVTIMCYKKQTISPESFEELANNPTLSKDLIENFKQVNQKIGEMAEEFDVKASLQRVSGDRDLEKLFPKVYKEFTETKGDPKLRLKVKSLIGLSRIGFNKDMSQALVYVEHFSSTTKLQKLYCLMPIHKISENNFDVFGNEIIVIPVK